MEAAKQFLHDGRRRIPSDHGLEQQQAAPYRREVLLRLGKVILHE